MEKLVNILYKYKHIFAENFTQLPSSDLIQHEIKLTSEKPIRQRHYRLAPFLEELQKDSAMNWKGVGLLKNPPVPGIVQRFSYKNLIIRSEN
jgi:hypothetical protein